MSKTKFSTTVLDSSFGAESLQVEDTVSGVGFHVQNFYGETKRYYMNDVVALEEIDAEVYRSVGKTAVGAIVGGLLTGGVGVIAGGALGAKQKFKGTYLVVFQDGNHIAFIINDKTTILKLKVVTVQRRAEEK